MRNVICISRKYYAAPPFRGHRYRLARILLDFAAQLPRYSSKDSELRLIVNRAEVYKWSGEEGQCKEILNAEDWSATSLKFKLAQAVLLDNFKEAIELVRKLGKDGELNKHEYREWPLFRELRKSAEFIALFEQIFGEPLHKITVSENETPGDPPPAIN
jgi:hypothetical protein